MYWAYILRCSDGTLYTGMTNDLTRRIEEHTSSRRGAKYTRTRRPLRLAYSQRFRSRSAALKKEAKIQTLTRAEKLALIRTAFRSGKEPAL